MQNQKLVHASKFSEALTAALEIHYGSSRAVNYADFSRRAGFASRSFLSELVAGKKGISPSSWQKIKRKLRLSAAEVAVLHAHACVENAELRSAKEDLAAAKKRLTAAQHQLVNGTADIDIHTARATVRRPLLFEIYAALGSVENGASLSEICRRTLLPEKTIVEALESLLASQLLDTRGDRYFASQRAVEYFSKEVTEDLGTLITEVAQDLKRGAQALARTPNGATYVVFSISDDRISEFRAQARQRILDLIEEFQNDEGNAIEKVFVASNRRLPV